jgi:hypothetical protein
MRAGSDRTGFQPGRSSLQKDRASQAAKKLDPEGQVSGHELTPADPGIRVSGSERALQAAEKALCVATMCQGTSLLVPKTPHFERRFRQCLTNLKSSGFVTGHGFSRAEKRAKNGGVLTP